MEEGTNGNQTGNAGEEVKRRKKVRIKYKKKKKFSLSELTNLSPRNTVLILLFLIVIFLLSLYYIIVYVNTGKTI